jgi:hypothetical protein
MAYLGFVGVTVPGEVIGFSAGITRHFFFFNQSLTHLKKKKKI